MFSPERFRWGRNTNSLPSPTIIARENTGIQVKAARETVGGNLGPSPRCKPPSAGGNARAVPVAARTAPRPQRSRHHPIARRVRSTAVKDRSTAASGGRGAVTSRHRADPVCRGKHSGRRSGAADRPVTGVDRGAKMAHLPIRHVACPSIPCRSDRDSRGVPASGRYERPEWPYCQWSADAPESRKTPRNSGICRVLRRR